MSAKPNIALARFADQPGADIVEPPSGLRDTGYVAGTPVAAGFMNALMFHHYEWDKYISDGDVALHNVTANTLELAGTLTCDVGAVIAGAITIGGNASIGGTLAVTGGTTLTGALAANGGLAITGTTTALGDVTVGNGHTVTLNGSTGLSVGGAASVSGVITASSGVKLLSTSGHGITHQAPSGLAADSSITWPSALPSAGRSTLYIDNTGAVLVGETRTFSAALGAPASTTGSPVFSSSPPFFDIGATGIAVVLPIMAPVGATITALFASVLKTSSNSFTVQAVLHDTTIASFSRTTTLIGSNAVNAPGSVDVGNSGLSIAVQAGHVYELHVNESTGQPGSGKDGVIGYKVTW
jgi:hypothetical protein